MTRSRPEAPPSTNTWQVLLDGGITEAMIATYHGHDFRPHFHETFAVGVALAGSHRVWCEGRLWQLEAGDVMVIPPRAIHTGVGGTSERWAIGMVFPPATMVTTHPRHYGVVLRAVPLASTIVDALRRSLLGRASAGQQLIDVSLQLMALAERCGAPMATTIDHRAREARDALDPPATWRIVWDSPTRATLPAPFDAASVSHRAGTATVSSTLAILISSTAS